MKKIVKTLMGVLLILIAGVTNGYATLLDPPLDIGNPPLTGTFLFGTEVRPISSTQLGILENGNGQPVLTSPFLLILGIPNVTTFAAPSVTLSSGTGIIDGSTGLYGGEWDSGTGYADNFTAATCTTPGCNDVYDFIGLDGHPNSSNNFSNWQAADYFANSSTFNSVTNPISGFGIFVYELSNTGISGGDTINVTFASPIPTGTFAVAYGQDIDGTKVFASPFTNSGLVTGPPPTGRPPVVPEPSTILLVGSGLLGVALCGRKKVNK